MIDICTRIKFNIPNLDKFGPPKNKGVNSTHHAHLVIESSKIIQLKVFYEEKTYLADKVFRWESKQDKTAMGKAIEFVELNETNLLGITIDNSNVITTQMSIGSSLFDTRWGKYFTINFDKVELIYNDKYKEHENSSFVELNDIFVEPLKHFYFTSSFANKERDTWSSKSRFNRFRKFHGFEYNLRYGFESKNNDEQNEVIIRKRPFIFLKHPDHSKLEIRQKINHLIGILGFFYNSTCYSPAYTIYTANKKFKFFSINKNIINYKPKSILREFKERYDILDFIRRCQLLQSKEIHQINTVVNRFNFACAIQGEAKFMLFYELFERLKTHYLKQSKNEKISYKLRISKREKSSLIKNLSKSFSSIFDEKDVQNIQNTFIQRVSSIKYKTLGSQYEILLKQLKLDSEKWLPIFEKANEYRNELFHGGWIDNESDEFIETTFKIKHFVALLIAKFYGVKLQLDL